MTKMHLDWNGNYVKTKYVSGLQTDFYKDRFNFTSAEFKEICGSAVPAANAFLSIWCLRNVSAGEALT